jgi:tRNA pseudouridine32 synthase/23S rRNA pseudouridine746 synthase
MSYLISFKTDLSSLVFPDPFPDPFSPVPHKIAEIAATELQSYLMEASGLTHNFGLDGGAVGLGKMFGVLVVRDQVNNTGYLAAFSGKLEDGTLMSGFVPPVFNTLDETGFYRLGEQEISLINQRILYIENQEEYIYQKQLVQDLQQRFANHVAYLKSRQAEAKKQRDLKRLQSQHSLTSEAYNALLKALEIESIRDHYLLKEIKKYYSSRITAASQLFDCLEAPIKTLKILRRQKSAKLQDQLFRHYRFLNAAKESMSLFDLFCAESDSIPPSGAGECTAPKLLQHAFEQGYRPIALAEFWWGRSPDSEIRKHGQFYAACNTKCRPILSHMLSGLIHNAEILCRTENNDAFFRVLWEDDCVLVISKVADVLSVPGKSPRESVYSRLKTFLPEATGPLLVHRLDMSTSGIMLVAKTKEVHKNLQAQFANRVVQKTYTALLSGVPEQTEGLIDLPLRVNLEDRPRQLVCYEHGKAAVTRWKLVEHSDSPSRVLFFPETGRTHQLRVHAAHSKGLNAPILGDDLYGCSGDRLYLHASAITFRHPETGKKMHFSDPAPF